MRKSNAALVLDSPTYSVALAARLTGVSEGRIRRWLCGYEYEYVVRGTSRRSKKAPVVRRGEAQASPFSSFLDLVDLLFVKRFLDHGLTLQRVRKALQEADAILGGHHFAQRSFFTDGREIYLQLDESADALLQLLAGGQWVIAPVILQTARQIDFDKASGFARRWFPRGRDGGVVLDPRIAFGAPTLIGRAIKTSNIYDLYLAERNDAVKVARWMDLPEPAVGHAVAFESELRVAA